MASGLCCERINSSGKTSPHYSLSTMTQKQIRDLQAFAIELAKEGKAEAAREVLALINR